jgi:hypothetical protein
MTLYGPWQENDLLRQAATAKRHRNRPNRRGNNDIKVGRSLYALATERLRQTAHVPNSRTASEASSGTTWVEMRVGQQHPQEPLLSKFSIATLLEPAGNGSRRFRRGGEPPAIGLRTSGGRIGASVDPSRHVFTSCNTVSHPGRKRLWSPGLGRRSIGSGVWRLGTPRYGATRALAASKQIGKNDLTNGQF